MSTRAHTLFAFAFFFSVKKHALGPEENGKNTAFQNEKYTVPPLFLFSVPKYKERIRIPPTKVGKIDGEESHP
jgi:hypothetical protein